VRAELNDTVVEIAKQVEKILLTAVFNINKRLKGRVDMTMALGLSDVKAQMAGLVYRALSPATALRLGDTLRYLQAIEKRLEKLAIDPHRDRAQMLKVESVQQAWQQWLNKLPPAAATMKTCRRSAG
jgi:ATP-dependent helicase HrpA